MSKICIFNTQVAEDSAGNPFNSVVPTPPADVSHTKPVRLFSGKEACLCTFEFVYTAAGGNVLTLNWWREFWGDDVRQSLQAPPSVRGLIGIPNSLPWSREVVEVQDPSGMVSQEPARRVMTLNVPLTYHGFALWVTTKVHAPWVRLALYAEAPLVGELLINAHVGGHAEDEYLTLNGHKPYAYNA